MQASDKPSSNSDLQLKAGKARSALVRLSTVVLVAAAAAYVAAAGYMYTFQRDFVFKPTGAIAAPVEKGLPSVSQEKVTLEDGTIVTVWQAPPSEPGAPTVLYFHGNSGNVSGRAPRFQQIIDSGMGLYAPSYRGYAGSEGSASEAAFVADGIEHFDRLSKTADSIILHGESLGTGVATAVAKERPAARMLVLEAPYTAALDIAADSYPWLPVSVLMKDPFLTRERITEVEPPIFIIHGTEDAVIPVDHGKALYEIADGDKRLRIVEGGKHSDLWTKGGLWPSVLNFLKDTSSENG